MPEDRDPAGTRGEPSPPGSGEGRAGDAGAALEKQGARRFLKLAVVLLLLFASCGTVVILVANREGGDGERAGGGPGSTGTSVGGVTVTPSMSAPPSGSPSAAPGTAPSTSPRTGTGNGNGDGTGAGTPPGGSPSPSPTVSPSSPPLPDLTIAGLTSSSVTVANAGSAPAAASVVSVSGKTSAVGGLGAGKATTISFACRTGTLVAVADASGQVVESDEGNNTRTAGPFTCPAADLVIRRLTGTAVTVANVGTERSGSFRISVNDPSLTAPAIPVVGPTPRILLTLSMGSIPAGGTRDLTFDRCLPNEATATADPGNQVSEQREDNNTRTSSGLTCPDLMIVAITRDDVTVRNRGNGPAAATGVQLSGGIGTLNVPALAAGAQASIPFPSCTAGSLTATADPARLVLESDESNNARTAGPFTCPLPDLVVTSLDGNGLIVANRGTGPSPTFDLTVTGLPTFRVARIGAGDTRELLFATCQTGNLTATADPADLVDESDETNNSRSAFGECPIQAPAVLASSLCRRDPHPGLPAQR